jgi:hypothetical protein
MRDGSTEQTDDSITNEFLDRPTVALNLSAHTAPIRLLDSAQILGVKSLPRDGEVDQVGEQRTDNLPLLTLRGSRNE